MSEVSELKAWISELEGRLAALEPKPADIKLAKYEEQGVTVTHHIERGAFEMPSKEQARKLIDLVQKRYSALRLPGEPSARDREVEFDRFLASFWYLGFADRRTDGLLTREDMRRGFVTQPALGCAAMVASMART